MAARWRTQRGGNGAGIEGRPMQAHLAVTAPGQADSHLLASIHGLLLAAFDDDFSPEDWEHTQGGWHLVAAIGDEVVGHAAVVPRDVEVGGRVFSAGYVEGVATAPQLQGHRIGSRVMAGAAAVIRANFALGALSTDRRSFYERLGWERWQGPTFVRDGDQLIRTADEDGGVLVLRFGPSANLDLTAPIAVPARSGDDW